MLITLWRASRVLLAVKNPPVNAGDKRDKGLIPGSGRSPGGGHGNHSSTLAWSIPWTEEPGRLQVIGFQRGRHDWSDLAWKHLIVIGWLVSWIKVTLISSVYSLIKSQKNDRNLKYLMKQTYNIHTKMLLVNKILAWITFIVIKFTCIYICLLCT